MNVAMCTLAEKTCARLQRVVSAVFITAPIAERSENYHQQLHPLSLVRMGARQRQDPRRRISFLLNPCRWQRDDAGVLETVEACDGSFKAAIFGFTVGSHFLLVGIWQRTSMFQKVFSRVDAFLMPRSCYRSKCMPTCLLPTMLGYGRLCSGRM